MEINNFSMLYYNYQWRLHQWRLHLRTSSLSMLNTQPPRGPFNSSLLTTRPTYMVNVSILSVCRFLLTPPQETKRKERNPKLVEQTVPDRIFFFSFPLTPPRGTRRTLPTGSALSVLDRFLHFPFPFLTPPRGTFYFFFCLHHLVAQSRSFWGIAKTVHNIYETR